MIKIEQGDLFSQEVAVETVTEKVTVKAPPAPKIYSVSQLSEELRETLKEGFGEVLLQAEIADFKGVHRSGHLYFALKDEKAQIRAVMWKGALQKVPFELKAGLEVVVTGRLDYYGGSGSLQIVCEKMQPVGMGALQLKFEQLKEKLQKEGLFAAERKKPVSAVNWRIGLVTSKTTAALQDMLKSFRDRFPIAEIFIFHASVQGEKAPSEVIAAIDRANRFSAGATKPLDVLIVARGGGSYEDLFCFNDEGIVRAIAQSKLPTVSAIGHQIDFTLSDFVADKRSATPSRAAEETVPEMLLWLKRLEELEARFDWLMKNRLSDERQRVDTLYNRLANAAPHKKIEAEKKLFAQKLLNFSSHMNRHLQNRKSQVSRLSSVLDALSPLKVLERGYSVSTFKESGKALRSVKEATTGAELKILLSDGSIAAKIL